VELDTDGLTILYKPDKKGDVIPDFAHVGYRSDLQPLPSQEQTPDVVILQASMSNGVDDRASIQQAIDHVSTLPINPTTGFRGAVRLDLGTFHVSGTLYIRASGVVLQGSGTGTNLIATAAKQHDVVKIQGPGSVKKVRDTRVSVIDDRVAVGAKTFQVSDAGKFAEGDLIVVRRPGTDAWIHAIGMDRIADCPSPACRQWKAKGYDLLFERVVQHVHGNTITIDAPLVEALDKRYGGGEIWKVTESRIKNVGVQNLVITSSFDESVTGTSKNLDRYYNDTTYHRDENHAWDAVSFANAADGWVKHLTCVHLGRACVRITDSAKHITVEGSISRDPVSKISGGRRYSFTVNGQLSLVRNCTTTLGRHDLVSGSKTAGPNVFVDCKAEKPLMDIGPHQRWSTGQLYDNIIGGQMNVRDRGHSGSGHGWAGNTIIFYNCKSQPLAPHYRGYYQQTGFTISSPITGANYCIGCVSESEKYSTQDLRCPTCGFGGHFLSKGQKRRDIPSLYAAQLKVQRAAFKAQQLLKVA